MKVLKKSCTGLLLLVLSSLGVFNTANADQRCTAYSPEHPDLVLHDSTLQGVINYCYTLTRDQDGCSSTAVCRSQTMTCSAYSPEHPDLVLHDKTLQGVIDYCYTLTRDRDGCESTAECKMQ